MNIGFDRHAFEHEGFALWEGAIAAADLATLEALGGDLARPVRNALDVREVLAFLRTSSIRHRVREAIGGSPFCVRGILFDKTGAANWMVPWHQDLTIAVRQREPLPGFRAWNIKDGVNHCTAPAEVLSGMLATRIHLDDCPASRGPLRVVPRSHARGIISAEERDRLGRSSGKPYVARRGDVIAMRPLLLHASSRAEKPTRRRVLHLEWAREPLPPPLEWRWRE